MPSRYSKTHTVRNDTEFYDFLRKKRGNLKNINHLETPILRHPTVSQRASLSTVGHIWSYGDRYYKLAHKYYGDSQYWWILAWYNSRPTEADIKTGDYIDIPLNLEKVLMVLGVY
jgi:hypothetical protein